MEEQGKGGGWCCSMGLTGLLNLGFWVTVVGLWLVCRGCAVGSVVG